jgi:hypothetical protein
MPTLSDEEFLAQAPAIEKQLEATILASETPAAVTPPIVEPAAPAPAPGSETPPSDPPVAADSAPPPEGSVEAPVTPEGETPPSEPDYKAVYDQLFNKPIRASGQDITLHTPEEAISLIQKGVGFHTKMNKVHGDLKYVEMLRNNDLLDEGKLSLLIDAQAGKPGAIKKLLDSAKVDPLELDSAEASTYAPSDHSVSSEQMQFQSVVSDLSGSDKGRAILTDAQAWDQGTKAEIYKTPGVLSLLAEQKELGRYDLIVGELKRAQILGQVPPGETFLQSYARVGQQMMQAGKFGEEPAPTPTPVAQKTITPMAPANSKKAAAAAPTRGSTASSAKPAVDINKMSDEAFTAHFRQTFNI